MVDLSLQHHKSTLIPWLKESTWISGFYVLVDYLLISLLLCQRLDMHQICICISLMSVSNTTLVVV